MRMKGGKRRTFGVVGDSRNRLGAGFAVPSAGRTRVITCIHTRTHAYQQNLCRSGGAPARGRSCRPGASRRLIIGRFLGVLSEACLEPLGGLLEASWGPPGACCRRPWSPLGASWGLSRASWGPLGASWGLLGGLLGASWGPPGSSWGPLGGSWGLLGDSWGPL